MKNLFSILIAVGLVAAALPARADTKLGTIDLQKVFKEFWKTRQADLNLSDDEAGYVKEYKVLQEKLVKEKDDYTSLLRSASDQVVSPEEREKRKKQAQEKFQQIEKIQGDIDQYKRMVNVTMGEKRRQLRDNVVKEIRESINAKAKAAGYDYVFDTSGETLNNTPVILFTKSGTDMTEEIIKELNSTAPPGVLKNIEKREKEEREREKAAKEAAEKKDEKKDEKK